MLFAQARQAQLHMQLPWAFPLAVPASCSLLCRGRQDFWICVLLTLLGYLPGALLCSLLPGLTAFAGEEQRVSVEAVRFIPCALKLLHSQLGTDSHAGLPVQVSFTPSTSSCGAQGPHTAHALPCCGVLSVVQSLTRRGCAAGTRRL
jgi:uncharacterized membrane protein YqaE (UPF0057 family)